ncbi:MAG: hypothetical protein ABIR98_13875 [Usitatibacter sp.]
MSLSARLILGGLMLVMGAIAGYIFFDWEAILSEHPHIIRPLKLVVHHALDVSWVVALGLPVVLVTGSVYRLVAARSGRMMILAKLFAWFTLWSIGSFAFYFGLFLTYAPGIGQGGAELAAPALAAIVGYMIIGLGFAISVLARP